MAEIREGIEPIYNPQMQGDEIIQSYVYNEQVVNGGNHVIHTGRICNKFKGLKTRNRGRGINYFNIQASSATFDSVHNVYSTLTAGTSKIDVNIRFRLEGAGGRYMVLVVTVFNGTYDQVIGVVAQPGGNYSGFYWPYTDYIERDQQIEYSHTFSVELDANTNPSNRVARTIEVKTQVRLWRNNPNEFTNGTIAFPNFSDYAGLKDLSITEYIDCL